MCFLGFISVILSCNFYSYSSAPFGITRYIDIARVLIPISFLAAIFTLPHVFDLRFSISFRSLVKIFLVVIVFLTMALMFPVMIVESFMSIKGLTSAFNKYPQFILHVIGSFYTNWSQWFGMVGAFLLCTTGFCIELKDKNI